MYEGYEVPADMVIIVGSGVGDIPDYTSFSQLSMVERCPYQYELRYLQGRVEPPSMGLSQGIVFHDVQEQANKHYIENGEHLETEDIEDAFNDRWKKGHRIGFGRGSAEEYIPWKEIESDKRKLDTCRNVGHSAQVTYHEKVGTKEQPTACEMEFRGIPIGNKTFTGYVDCESAIGKAKGKAAKKKAIDYKLIGRKYDAKAAHGSMQLASYAWAKKATTGKAYDKVAFHTIVKKNIPEVQKLEAPMSDLRIAAFERWAELQLHIIDSERFVGRQGPHCNWCGYKSDCPWFNGRGFGAVPETKLTVGKT